MNAEAAELELESTKTLLYIRNLLEDLKLCHLFIDGSIPIYNDNQSVIQWSYNMTQKATRYIQIRENAVREEVQSGFILPKHIARKHNLADLYTKELKDVLAFETIRDILVVSEAEALNSLPTLYSLRGVLKCQSICPP